MKQFIIGAVYLASLFCGIFLLQMGSWVALPAFGISLFAMNEGINYIEERNARKENDF